MQQTEYQVNFDTFSIADSKESLMLLSLPSKCFISKFSTQEIKKKIWVTFFSPPLSMRITRLSRYSESFGISSFVIKVFIHSLQCSILFRLACIKYPERSYTTWSMIVLYPPILCTSPLIIDSPLARRSFNSSFLVLASFWFAKVKERSEKKWRPFFLAVYSKLYR